MYLLDVNVCLGYIFGEAIVVDRARPNLDLSYIPATVLAELIAKEHLFRDPNVLEELGDFLRVFKKRVVNFDVKAAIEYGRISNHLRKVGGKASVQELMIAAMANAQGAVIATNRIGIQRIQPIFPSLRLVDWYINEKTYQVIFETQDRPGVLHKVALCLASLNINILDAYSAVREQQLKFTLSSSEVIIIDHLERNLHTVGLEVNNLIVQSETSKIDKYRLTIPSGHAFVLQINMLNLPAALTNCGFSVSGVDRPGLIAEITAPIFLQNQNLTRFTSASFQGDETMSFLVSCLWNANSACDFEALETVIRGTNSITSFSWLERPTDYRATNPDSGVE